MMRLTLLIFSALILPLIWGWSMHWIISRFWPLRTANSDAARRRNVASPPIDYQI